MRRAFTGLAVLLPLAVVVQFFLAASGAYDPAPTEESFQAHRALGSAIILLAVLVTVAAAAARMPRRLIGLCGLTAGLAAVQIAISEAAGLADAGTTAGDLVFGLHAVNGLAILAVAARIARQARRMSRPATPVRQAP
jgi:cytochrome b561